MTDRYAVMGNPIAHSKSPDIHTAFALQTEQDIGYAAILVQPDQFAQAVADFRAQGGMGLNITVPFKQQAWQLADERSKRAELAGAVNTLYFKPEGICFGDNTDGAGLLRDIVQNHHGQIAAQHILLLGAGGAARGVLGPLLDEQPASLTIANRTTACAIELAQQFSSHGNISGCGFDQLQDKQFDLIINATSASLKGEVPELADDVIASGGWVYDMMYQAQPTTFMQWGTAHGARMAVDGLGMLVEQAAESFYIWRGVRPNTAPVIAQLRESMQ